MTFDVATMLGGALIGGFIGWHARAYFGRGAAALRKLRGGWNGANE